MKQTIVVLVSLLALTTSSFSDGSLGPKRLTYKEFERLSYIEREQRLLDLSMEDQVAAFLVMMNESHPPDLELAFRMAPGGWPLARIVLSRIGSDRDEWVQARLILLLSAIQVDGYADLRADQKVIAMLDGVVDKMENPERRKEASDWLGLIKKVGAPP
jgi:hypothetical protein